MLFFFFSSRRRHTRFDCDWSSDVCSSDLIEQHKPDLDAEVMLDAVCTDQERASVRRAPDRLAAFYQRWVGKEAVLKAIGIGVADHLRSKIGRASCRERV